MLDNLKAQKRWFCWRLENKKDSKKPTKVPYSAITGRRTGTSSEFAGTWTDFNSAQKYFAKSGMNGVGFALPKNMFFLDIDHAGLEDIRVKNIISRFSSYTELSQSGNGIHIYGYVDNSKIPTELNEKGETKLHSKYYQKHPTNGLELYFGFITNRYAAFTGNAVNEVELQDCTETVLEILEEYMLRKPKEPIVQVSNTSSRSSASYEFKYADDDTEYSLPQDAPDRVKQVVHSLMSQKNNEKFKTLFFRGDKSAYVNAGEIDDSRADAALCSQIAFRVGPDNPKLIEEVFNYSAICRDKWR
ncbi:MAG: hypothetical protein HUK24_07725, partial [Sphaerochaetaceae bacterium]|nr:hypothetical protein [Sphaerochaetaceae bacterium]